MYIYIYIKRISKRGKKGEKKENQDRKLEGIRGIGSFPGKKKKRGGSRRGEEGGLVGESGANSFTVVSLFFLRLTEVNCSFVFR